MVKEVVLNVQSMLEVNFDPKKKHLTDIKTWLIDEWNEVQTGFYCNWNIIEEQFAEKDLFVITDNDYAIGFITSRIYELHAVIDIVEIKPAERKKGVAKKLIEGTLDHFQRKGALVVRLYCSPENSEGFWKRIGFENFPDLHYDTKINLFKPLVETLLPKEKAETKTTIRLWNCEPYQADNVSAKWIWDLIFSTDNLTLVKPIIFPVSSDWQVDLIRNGQNVISDKVKRFPVDMADYGGFMIIRKVNV